jgi:hypothetical protein
MYVGTSIQFTNSLAVIEHISVATRLPFRKSSDGTGI